MVSLRMLGMLVFKKRQAGETESPAAQLTVFNVP